MIDIEVEDGRWAEALSAPALLVETAARRTFDELDRLPSPLSVLLTDDATVADLNGRFLGKDGPTNVLSFPAAANPEGFLGDIALAFGVCALEAEAQGKPLAHHLQHLVAHGVLHLLGYDHQLDDEAERMEGLERAVLASLGVPDPYGAEKGSHG